MVAILVAILMLGVLITFHEFGHFVFAKLFGVGVLRFSIGFGPIIRAIKIGETEYALSAVPFGGYVQMVGDEDASALEGGKEVPPVGSEKSFALRPIWQKAIIIFAGPGFNILLAAMCLIFLFVTYGIPKPTNTVGEVIKDTPAEQAGIEPGDKIKFICPNGSLINCGETSTWEKLQSSISKASGTVYLIAKTKCGDPSCLKTTKVIAVTPKLIRQKNIFGEDFEARLIGISPRYVMHYDAKEAIAIGLAETWIRGKVILLALGRLVKGKTKPNELGGPITIVQASGSAWENGGLAGILGFAAFISMNLGIVNLLPIPVLDGGYLFIFLLEGITRRKVTPKTKEIVQRIGFLFLLSLMLYVTWNDILRFFH